MQIYMKLVYQYMVIFSNFPLTSNHLHSLRVENWDSNSQLVVDKHNIFMTNYAINQKKDLGSFKLIYYTWIFYT